jgi:hypothetical protein
MAQNSKDEIFLPSSTVKELQNITVNLKNIVGATVSVSAVIATVGFKFLPLSNKVNSRLLRGAFRLTILILLTYLVL